MILYMYIRLQAMGDNPSKTKLLVTERLVTLLISCKSQKVLSSLYKSLYMGDSPSKPMKFWSFVVELRRITYVFDLILIYINLKPMADNPLSAIRKLLSLQSFFCQSQKDYFHLWFYTEVFMISYMYINFRARADNFLGKQFSVIESLSHSNHLLLISEGWLSSQIIYRIFKDCIHKYSAEAGADNPEETQFWCQQKSFVSFFMCCKFVFFFFFF